MHLHVLQLQTAGIYGITLANTLSSFYCWGSFSAKQRITQVIPLPTLYSFPATPIASFISGNNEFCSSCHL